jgi:hypothetical protein
VPVAGSVIVTTPQDLALLDAKKGVEMFRKVNIPVLGVVENMAVHICSNCGHAEHLFGEGGEKLAAAMVSNAGFAAVVDADSRAGRQRQANGNCRAGKPDCHGLSGAGAPGGGADRVAGSSGTGTPSITISEIDASSEWSADQAIYN